MKKTLTIGIPAYNEEGNIALLIESILAQKNKLYILKKIIIVSDGSTDKTNEIVKTISKRNSLVQLVSGVKRSGKPIALNKIHQTAETDYLISMDADLVFKNNSAIDEMITVLESDKEIQIVSARLTPVYPQSYIGRCAAVSFESFEEAAMKIRAGNNIFTALSIFLMKKDFYKQFSYPENAQGDQCYLYAKATEENINAYKLSPKATAYFLPVATFYDWRLLAVRSTKSDKENVISFFGDRIAKEYHMPRSIFFPVLLKWFIKHPLLTSGSIFMNLFVRLFPIKEKVVNGSMWKTTSSSKTGIEIDNLS